VALRDGQLGGYAIGKGDTVFVSGVLAHMDETVSHKSQVVYFFSFHSEGKSSRLFRLFRLLYCSLSLLPFSPPAQVFKEPDTFEPARFFPDPTLAAQQDPAATEALGLFPFGTGRHVCAGRNFAMTELRSAVTVIMQRYQFETVSGGVPPYKFGPAGCDRPAEAVRFTRLRSDYFPRSADPTM
jgi:cytochrome P450